MLKQEHSIMINGLFLVLWSSVCFFLHLIVTLYFYLFIFGCSGKMLPKEREQPLLLLLQKLLLGHYCYLLSFWFLLSIIQFLPCFQLIICFIVIYLHCFDGFRVVLKFKLFCLHKQNYLFRADCLFQTSSCLDQEGEGDMHHRHLQVSFL